MSTPYPHLALTENIMECLAGASEESWRAFFESLRQCKYQQFATVANTEGLTAIQGAVKMVGELEGIFIGIRQARKSAIQTKNED